MTFDVMDAALEVQRPIRRRWMTSMRNALGRNSELATTNAAQRGRMKNNKARVRRLREGNAGFAQARRCLLAAGRENWDGGPSQFREQS